MKVLGIVPARAGSKGLVGKNVRPLHGKPLLYWVAQAMLSSPGITRALCSTDSEEIANHAREAGLDVPFLRPAELANDRSSVIEAVLDVVDKLEAIGEAFTHVLLAQPTSPTLMPEDISAALELLRTQGFDSVVSVTPIPHMFSPAAAFTVTTDGELVPLFSTDELAARRQDLPAYYARAGLLYLSSVERLRQTGNFYGGRLGLVKIDSFRAVSIDDANDFARAEAVVASTVGNSVGTQFGSRGW